MILNLQKPEIQIKNLYFFLYILSYLTDVAYKKYKPSFYKLDEPTPGEGGSGGGKGKLITKQKLSLFKNWCLIK